MELTVAVVAVGFFLNDMFFRDLNLFVSTGVSMVTIRFGCSYLGRFAGGSLSAGFCGGWITAGGSEGLSAAGVA